MVSVAEVVTLSPAQASVKVMASGYVVPQRKALVASKQPGRLEQVVVKEGQDVEAGQLLATMEFDDVRASLTAPAESWSWLIFRRWSWRRTFQKGDSAH